jgi:hypothetical protein
MAQDIFNGLTLGDQFRLMISVVKIVTELATQAAGNKRAQKTEL